MLSALQEICFLTVTNGQLSRKSRSVMDLTVAKERQKDKNNAKPRGELTNSFPRKPF